MSRMRQYRTIWISDVHLGTRGCKADFLIDFLRYNDAETIYLVGDIIDGWRLKRSWYWPQAHNDVVQKVLRKVRKGAQVIYVPGNHDEWLRDYTLMQFGGVDVAEEVIHVTADGRRLLVIHGDVFDAVVDEALRRGVDGVVCGHIHYAEMREIKGVLYCNDGDWVESCTALVEHFDGRLELVNWIDKWALDPLTGRVPAATGLEEEDEVPVLIGMD